MNPKSPKTLKVLATSLFVPVALAAAFASPAFAQTPAKAPAVAPAPAAAPAAPVTPEQRTAIRELLDLTHTREGLQGALQQMSQGLRPQLGQMMAQRIELNSALSADQKTKVRASMEQPFETAVADGGKMLNDPKVIDDVMDRMVAAYARTFTLDEIRQLNAFYKSPLGQKTINGVPAVGREAMQGMMSTLAPKLNALADSTVQKQVDQVTSGSAGAPAKAAPATKK